MNVPPGHAKVKIVKAVIHARTELAIGSTAILDSDSAARLIREGRAVAVAPEPERDMHNTYCPRCRAPMSYPKEVRTTSEQWTSCLGCGFGWLRDRDA